MRKSAPEVTLRLSHTHHGRAMQSIRMQATRIVGRKDGKRKCTVSLYIYYIMCGAETHDAHSSRTASASSPRFGLIRDPAASTINRFSACTLTHQSLDMSENGGVEASGRTNLVDAQRAIAKKATSVARAHRGQTRRSKLGTPCDIGELGGGPRRDVHPGRRGRARTKFEYSYIYKGLTSTIIYSYLVDRTLQVPCYGIPPRP